MSHKSYKGHPDHVKHPNMNHGSQADHMMNHSSIDHIEMDSMDHKTYQISGFNDHSVHGMSMFFHGGYCETILFEFWKISSVNGFIGSIIGVIIMAALYEGLKYYREYVFMRTCNGPNCRGMSRGNNMVVDDNPVVQLTMLSFMHTYQTSLHIVQTTISYLLMLIFMTYNIWLCLAVILGTAIGFFLFGWKKSVIVDVTEHCH